jgi:hypothetical protein
MSKGRAARMILEGLAELLGEDGRRLKKAVEETVAVVGEEGAKCLDDGDVIGCVLETTRNARKRKKKKDTE